MLKDMEYFDDDLEVYNCTHKLEKATDCIVKELKRVQAMKEMQQELIDALVEKTCVEKDILDEISKKDNELISALMAIDQTRPNWQLWLGLVSAVIVSIVLCHCGRKPSSKGFFESIWKSPRKYQEVLDSKPSLCSPLCLAKSIFVNGIFKPMAASSRVISTLMKC